MKKLNSKTITALAAAMMLAAGCGHSPGTPGEPVDYVDPTIGTISHLLVPTFQTVQRPNSMLRMIPARYEITQDRIDGLPLNFPSHRYGDVLIMMPVKGDTTALRKTRDYRFDHERSTPYSYSVFLDDHGIAVDFAPAEKSAIYALTFEEPGARMIALKTRGEGYLDIIGPVMSGYDTYHGTKHYFYLEFDTEPVETGHIENGGRTMIYARFADNVGKVSARYGISYISTEQASKNLKAEIADFNLERVAREGRGAWNDALGKIRVEGGTENEKKVFYTALYRSHERMINISEDGRYWSAYDRRVHDDEGVPFWVDDWAWDTYLALHPLQILLNPGQQAEKINSYIRMGEQSGWIPTFPCVFGDAHCMNGNHAAGIFADAMKKGIPFDLGRAYELVKHTLLTESMIPWYRGPKTELDDFYHENGWFPALHPGEKETCPQVNDFEKRQSVAVTTGAAYDDWAAAQMALKLGLREDYEFFRERSYNYRKVFNRDTGFFHPRDKDGKFIEPFDYKLSGGIGARDYYDENNGWTYNWDIRHDIEGLIMLFGSRERFIEKLDQLFAEPLGLSKWQYYAVLPDSSGNVGQFVMGNEPSFHIPYLYNYVGEPWKTQKRIRSLMEQWFRNDRMGIPGDEDGGGMSAFYVFSALGFYPVSPGVPVYNIGSPLFERSSIRLDNGREFTVVARDVSHENKYIQSARLNGAPHDRPWFTHDELMNGGSLELTMGPRPNKNWGSDPENAPPSRSFSTDN